MLAAIVVVAMTFGGCASNEASGPPPEPQGPASAQPDVVEEHAAQFDDTLGERPAGSQQELAAATYILAHLQQAGYVPLLDPVPVEDAVRSTNVVAPPPGGEDPRIVVTVAYDTASGESRTGHDLGLWLELARAIYAREQDHAVAFVALGAEHADVGDGNLGSRRLIEFLRDDDLDPLIVELRNLSPDGDAAVARGPEGDGLVSIGESLDVPATAIPERTALGVLLARAGLAHMEVSGGVDEVSEVLLEYLVVDGA